MSRNFVKTLDNLAKSRYDREKLGDTPTTGRGDLCLFPHLYAMKESNHLSADDMGAIIGKSRQTYLYKAQCGNFTPSECKALCRHFRKSFEYLFATMEEIDAIDALVASNQGYEDAAGADHAGEKQEAC